MKNIYASFKLMALIALLATSINSIAQTYCAPTFSSGCSNWKNQSITLNTINWTAPATCTMWDFTATSTNMTAGVATPMSVTNGVYCGCSVWVDFNSDGDFDDAGENLYALYTANATNTYNFNITIPAATPNGLYRMRVIASWGSDGVNSVNGSGGCGAYQYGNYDDFTLNVGGVTPCTAPTGLGATAITSTGATISWTASAGALAYEYVVSTNATQPVGNGTTISASPYVATSLIPATVYYAFVRSYCGAGGYSPWSYIIFTTPSAPCLAPTGLNATTITSSSATVSWTAVAGASNYEYVIDNTASNPVGAGTSIATTSYNATSLTPATVYYLHVRTNCGGAANFSTWTSIPFTTLANAPCVAPTGMAASSITSTSATINWNTAAGALAYEYVVSTSATQPVGNGTTISNPPYVASALTPTTVYYAYVRSYCGAGGYSPWSYVIFTTPSPTSVNDVNENQLKLLVSPNPVINNMYVTIANQKSNASISLVDLFGKVISTYKISAASFNIDLSNVSSGVYFVRYTDDMNSKTIKIMKQ